MPAKASATATMVESAHHWCAVSSYLSSRMESHFHARSPPGSPEPPQIDAPVPVSLPRPPTVYPAGRSYASIGNDVVQALRVQSLRSAVLRQRQSPGLRLPKMDQVSPCPGGLLTLCRRHRALCPRPIAVSTASTHQITTESTWFLERLRDVGEGGGSTALHYLQCLRCISHIHKAACRFCHMRNL